MIKGLLFVIIMSIIPLLVGVIIDHVFIMSSDDNDILLVLTGMSSGVTMGSLYCWLLMRKPKERQECDKCNGKGVIEN